MFKPVLTVERGLLRNYTKRIDDLCYLLVGIVLLRGLVLRLSNFSPELSIYSNRHALDRALEKVRPSRRLHLTGERRNLSTILKRVISTQYSSNGLGVNMCIVLV